jgi:hypothetical protein
LACFAVECGRSLGLKRSVVCRASPEISPKEFAQFIGKEMRLSKVEYAPRAESGPIFNFYMGKNTPERKDYIMDKLVVPVVE